MQLGGQRDAPATLFPGRGPQWQLYWTMDGLQGRSGRVWRREELLPPPRFEPRTVQPVARHYTACTIPASNLSFMLLSCRMSAGEEELNGIQYI